MTVTFFEDHVEVSHWAFDIVNNSSSDAWLRATYKNYETVDIQVPAKQSQRWVLTRGEEILDIAMMLYTDMTPTTFFAEKTVTTTPKAGQTFILDERAAVTVEDLQLKLPVCDVAVKIWNQSNDFVWIRIYYAEDKWVWFTLKGNQPPFIWYMPNRPITIQYTRTDPKNTWAPEKIINWKSGMTICICPKNLMNTDFEVVEVLTRLGMVEKYGTIIDKHELDYDSFTELTDSEMIEMGLPIGPRKRLRKELTKINKTTTQRRPADGQWDLFIAHRPINGIDLAASIKLQMELLHPETKVFLDNETENNLFDAEQQMKNTVNILIVVTEGALERPLIQKIIRIAVQQRKNLILVHDDKNCVLPEPASLPEDIRGILDMKRISYGREKVLRDVCMQSIWMQMQHSQ